MILSKINDRLAFWVIILVTVLAGFISLAPASASSRHYDSPQAVEQNAVTKYSENVSSQSLDYSGEPVKGKNLWQKIGGSFENNIIREQRWKLILNGFYYTVIIAFFSLLFGALLGCGVCAMRMSKNHLLKGVAICFIDLIRGIPVLLLLMILFYAVFAKVGLGAIPVSIITFALFEAAYSSEIYRAGLQSIDPGQKRAGTAMGFTQWQTFRYIILPQTVKRVLPVFKGEAVSLLKTTSIVGYIAVSDLTKAGDIIRSRTFDAFFPLIIITIIYFVLSWLLGKGLDLLGRMAKYNKYD